jgi:hypothetical protein
VRLCSLVLLYYGEVANAELQHVVGNDMLIAWQFRYGVAFRSQYVHMLRPAARKSKPTLSSQHGVLCENIIGASYQLIFNLLSLLQRDPLMPSLVQG